MYVEKNHRSEESKPLNWGYYRAAGISHGGDTVCLVCGQTVEDLTLNHGFKVVSSEA